MTGWLCAAFVHSAVLGPAREAGATVRPPASQPAVRDVFRHKDVRHICVFLSDDGGKTWRMGADANGYGIIREFALAEVGAGGVYYNSRSNDGQRRVAWSSTSGEAFGDFVLDKALPGPRCHAGLVALDPPSAKRVRLAFSCPGNRHTGKGSLKATRSRLTVYLRTCMKTAVSRSTGILPVCTTAILAVAASSAFPTTRRGSTRARRPWYTWAGGPCYVFIRVLSGDAGRTWGVSRVLHGGPAAYSDLAALPDGTLACLFERGKKSAYDGIALATFPADWLEAARDHRNQGPAREP